MNKGQFELISFLGSELAKFILHVNKVDIDKRKLPNHWHPEIELIFFEAGDNRIWINNREMPVKNGSIFIINSNESHSFIQKNIVKPQGCTVIISYKYLKKLYKNIDNCYFVLDKNKPQYTTLKIILKRLIYIYQHKSSDKFIFFKINNLINNIIYILLSYFCIEKVDVESITKKYEKRYQLIVQYIEQHYTENIRLEDIATHFGFSKEHFSRSFKKYMNITFKDYLLKRRLLNAVCLLKTTDRAISQIALDSGFINLKTFYGIFKKYYHTTPRLYRKNLTYNLSIKVKENVNKGILF